MRQFFVYIHLKPDGVPFYVGKGSGKRATDFYNGRNRHHKHVVAHYGRENIGILTFECDSEASAMATEIEYIRQFRDAGIKLANVCDGGEGATGVKRSAETRAKMSAYHRNRTPEHKLKMTLAKVGSTHRVETKARLSEVAKARAFNPMLGRRHSPEAIAKMSAARKAKPPLRDANTGRFA